MSKQLKIYTIEDKKEERFLREKSLPVTKNDLKDKDFVEFLDDLLYTALHSEEQDNVSAGGIAAPQVGVNKRVFHVLNYDTNKWQLFINPEVTPLGFVKTITKEGCLSVPNIEEDVMRYKKIKVKYQNIKGDWKTEKYSDLNAVSIQHELDHLDGILFIDRIK
jgi:peptide deformylase